LGDSTILHITWDVIVVLRPAFWTLYFAPNGAYGGRALPRLREFGSFRRRNRPDGADSDMVNVCLRSVGCDLGRKSLWEEKGFEESPKEEGIEYNEN